jgi:hypothetical protein
MLAKATAFFAPASGLEMVTDCAAPAGSGLAGSSALPIAGAPGSGSGTGSWMLHAHNRARSEIPMR